MVQFIIGLSIGVVLGFCICAIFSSANSDESNIDKKENVDE